MLVRKAQTEGDLPHGQGGAAQQQARRFQAAGS